ncbi:MAG: FHA domain-containing protein, partial [Planctomycetota bacterium]
MPRLEITRNGRSLRCHEITSAQTVVGRDAACDLVLDGAHVDERHGRIMWNGDVATIHDLDSLSGIRVNVDWVDGSVALEDGDTVRIGACDLRFIDPPLERENRRLERELRGATRCQNELERTLAGARGAGKTESGRVEALTAEIASLQSELAQVGEQRDELGAALVTLQRRTQDDRDRTGTMADRCKQAEEALAGVRRTRDANRDARERAEAALTATRAELAAATSRLAEMAAEIEATRPLAAEVEDARARAAQSESTAREAEAARDEAEAARTELHERLNTLLAERMDDTSASGEVRGHTTEEIDGLRAQLALSVADAGRLHRDLAALGDRARADRLRLETDLAAAIELSMETDSLRAECGTLTEQLSAADAERARLEDELAAAIELSVETDSLRAECGTL